MLATTTVTSAMAPNSVVGTVNFKLGEETELESSSVLQLLLTHAPPNYAFGIKQRKSWVRFYVSNISSFIVIHCADTSVFLCSFFFRLVFFFSRQKRLKHLNSEHLIGKSSDVRNTS